MALSANTVWEVRQGGSDTNGGGFVDGASGTDWSQQDAAQYSVTDGVTDGTTTITSATANFGTDVVGNLIYVEGGTGSVAADWYQITARTDASTITVDRSTGLTAGTGVTLKIGGALASPALATARAAAGNTIYIKYSATPFDITSSSTDVSGGRIEYRPDLTITGYDSTRSTSNTDANRPTIRSTVGSINMIEGVDGFSRRTVIRQLIIDGNSQSSVVGLSSSFGGDQLVLERIRVVNCTTGFSGAVSAGYFLEASLCGVGFGGTSTGVMVGCYAHDNSSHGFGTSGGGITHLMFCISADNGGKGFYGGGHSGHTQNCVAYNNAGNGFEFVNDSRLTSRAANCIAYGNGGYGFAGSSGVYGTPLTNCAGGSNTSGNVQGTPRINAGFVALSADPFTNAAAGDFSLNNTAGGGAACRAAGFPGVFPGGTTTGYLDIGAVQHQDAGGGTAGARLVGPSSLITPGVC